MNPNEPEIQTMVPMELLSFFDKGGGDTPEVNGLKDDWVSKSPRQVMIPGKLSSPVGKCVMR